MKGLFASLCLAVATGGGAPAQLPDDPALELRAVRFFRTAGARTLVDLFGRVPFAMLDPLPGGQHAAYRVTVSVRDSTGLELLSESWTQTVAARVLSVGRASAVEHVSFAAPAGRYAVEFVVTDSATGRVSRRRLTLETYAGAPQASDLLVGTGLRLSTAGDTAVRAGEVRKGTVVIEASGWPVLTPQQPRLSYYVEIYRERAETVTVGARVEAQGGEPARLTVPAGEQRLALEAGGGVTRGSLDLAGLPPGNYGLVLSIALADSAIERRAEFGMAGFETEAAVARAAEPDDRFSMMTEAQLDTLYLPLVYLMATDEQGLYEPLSAQGKRNYLRRFWAKRDPTPGTAANEAQEDFYRRIRDANTRFREGGVAQVPGWRTDRGRIFVKYGPPDEILQRPQAGNTNPYEVWKYTRGRALKYVFLDVTRFGNYSLIYTNDRQEPSRPNWEALLGSEAVIDVQRF